MDHLMKRNTLFGYVGGKSLLKPRILEALSRFEKSPYREPFFGGGSVGLHMMAYYRSEVWVNDWDVAIHCLWQCVKRFPDQLKALVREFQPSRDNFYKLKAFLLSNPVPVGDDDIIRVGFAKLACHRTSYSGLGVMSRGPRGPDETLVRKWSPDYVCEQTDKLHPHFQRVRLTQGDYSDLILDESEKSLLYLDPPYYKAGPVCYQHSFRHPDHVRLSGLLRATTHDWLLSYDDHPAIRNLYQDWSDIATIEAPYSITSKKTKTELLISRR
jgi:DNA adenine methylase